MTLQRRILVGHLLFTTILLGVVVYSFVLLRGAYDSKRPGFYTEFGYGDVELIYDRLQEIANLNSASPGPGDPSFDTAVAQRLADSRKAYFRLARRRRTIAALSAQDKPPGLPALEAIYGAVPESDSEASEGDADAPPGGPALDAASAERLASALAEQYKAHLPTEAQVAAAAREVRELSAWLHREFERHAAAAVEATRHIGSIVAIVVAASLALAAISSVLAIRRTVKPIHRLMGATESIAAGSLGVRLSVSGNDEFANLTRAFNNMTDELALARKRESDFLAVATHELKTPLACIKADAGMIRKLGTGGAAGADIATYLGRIDGEIASLTQRVEKLLDLGVIEAGQLRLRRRDFMAEGFLRMAAGAMRPVAAEKKIRYDVVISEGIPPMLNGDPDKLRQVISNVLDNAFKYTPSGGSVRFMASAKAEGLLVEISDTGPGIPSEQLGTIFEKYTRVRSDATTEPSGTGLGLAVALGIVKAHGGTIEAHSEPGRGSRFLIHIPAGSVGSTRDQSRREQPA